MYSAESPQVSENKPPAKTSPLIVFGEVLFDCFPDGRRVLGGAPFNVAWGLKGFGQDPVFVSAVGADTEGDHIRRQISDWGMRTDALQTDARYQTGDVQIVFNSDEPQYEICAPRAWDFVRDEGYEATELIYHGLLALREETTRKSFEAIQARSKAKRFFDINLRPPYDDLDTVKRWIRGVDWLKLNIDELGEVLGEGAIEFASGEKHLDRLREEFGVDNILLTGGIQGAMIKGSFGKAVCTPAPAPVEMVDTVGAGDSFSAVAIHGILSGLPADVIISQASQFAAKICAMRGATSRDVNFYQYKL
jgi:fructokinase